MGFVLILGATLLALALNGCSTLKGWTVRDATELPPYEGLGYTHREPTVQERILSASDFSVELVRFEDARYPRSTAFTAPDEVLYEYEPDELMQGITYRVPVLMNKYMAYRPVMPKHYKVEMELLTFQTRIIGGDWKSGRFGRYFTRVEARMVARRPDSRVVLNRVYRFNIEQTRDTFNGRSPTKEMDRGRMYDLGEALIRRLAEESAWDIRRFDAMRWDLERENLAKEQAGEVNIRPSNIKPTAKTVESKPGWLEPTTMEQLITPPAKEAPLPTMDDSVQG
ncbi:MAG: hypothetical protein WAZ18_03995 [Alphaproteobacteria bacterium]